MASFFRDKLPSFTLPTLPWGGGNSGDGSRSSSPSSSGSGSSSAPDLVYEPVSPSRPKPSRRSLPTFTIEKIPEADRPLYCRVLSIGIIVVLGLIIFIVGLAVGLNRRGSDDASSPPPEVVSPPSPSGGVVPPPIGGPDDGSDNLGTVVYRYDPLPANTRVYSGAAILAPQLFIESSGPKTECGYRANNDLTPVGSPGYVRLSYKAFDIATEQGGGRVEGNRLCGMMVRITRDIGDSKGNVSVDARVVGRCPEGVCDGESELGVARGVWRSLSGQGDTSEGGVAQVGETGVAWAWLPGAW